MIIQKLFHLWIIVRKKNSPLLQRITDRDETFILKDRTIADSYHLKLMPLLKSAIDLKAFMNTAININEIKTLILLLRFPLPSTLGDRKTMMQGSGVGGGHVRARRPTWRQGAWASLRPKMLAFTARVLEALSSPWATGLNFRAKLWKINCVEKRNRNILIYRYH